MIQPDYTTLRGTPYRNCLSENRANWQIHPGQNTRAFYPRTCMSSAWISTIVNDSFDAYSESVSINNYQPYRYTVCLILSKTNPGTGYSRYTTLVCVYLPSYAVLIYSRPLTSMVLCTVVQQVLDVYYYLPFFLCYGGRITYRKGLES